MTKDLTVGSPSKVLLKFTLPLMGSIIFQQLYNIADSLIAGKFIGKNALAAVGNGYEVTLIYLAFAFGCNVGCSVIISQFFGAKRYNDVKTSVTTTFISSAFLCGFLIMLGFLFTPMLLRLINTPQEIMSNTLLYLNIYTGGLFFLFFYNIANGIFSALGDSKTPFYFLAASSTANIGMDVWFVKSFNMGVAGVAWATFICQGISCVLAVIALVIKIRGIKTETKFKVFSFSILGKITRIAVPSILQQSFISVGNMFIQSLVNGFGTATIAGYSAAIKVNNFSITTFTTLGTATSNFSAQNLGAMEIDRVKKGFKSGAIMAVAVAGVFTLCYLLFRSELIGLFMNGDSVEALKIGIKFIIMVAPFYFLPAIKLQADGILRGSGAMNYFMIATFTDLILRVVLAFVFSPIFGSLGIWLSWPIGWLCGTSLSVIFYKIGVWKRNSI